MRIVSDHVTPTPVLMMLSVSTMVLTMSASVQKVSV